MPALLEPPRIRNRQAAPPARAVVSERILISEGETPIGAIHLDVLERVLKCDAGIPRDVAFKALVLYTRRGWLTGETVSRENGRTYAWDVLDEDEW
jgi:hypothetical protein